MDFRGWGKKDPGSFLNEAIINGLFGNNVQKSSYQFLAEFLSEPNVNLIASKIRLCIVVVTRRILVPTAVESMWSL